MTLQTIANLITTIAQSGANAASKFDWYETKVPKKLLEKQK